MICRCFGQTLDLGLLAKRLDQTAHLMVGMPDYDAYLAHATAAHPDRAPLSREAYYRERQLSRFGGVLRCC